MLLSNSPRNSSTSILLNRNPNAASQQAGFLRFYCFAFPFTGKPFAATAAGNVLRELAFTYPTWRSQIPETGQVALNEPFGGGVSRSLRDCRMLLLRYRAAKVKPTGKNILLIGGAY